MVANNQFPEARQPNQGACALYTNETFQQRVDDFDGIDCSQLAQELQEASGNVGGQMTINPPPDASRVKHLVGSTVVESNYHTVYTDGEFVFDPRHDRNTPVPKGEWETVIRNLNGIEIEFEFMPARSSRELP